MKLEIEPKATEEISGSPVLQQTAFWAKVKSKHGQNTLAFDVDLARYFASSPGDGRRVKPVEGVKQREAEDLLVILQKPGTGASIAYIPYGPKFRPPDEDRGLWLEQLSESLRQFLPSDCFMVRYDLLWDSPWVEDENRYDELGSWMGPPEPRVREMRMNFDTYNWQLRKAPTDILPSHTVFIDLTQREEEILANMKPKTRYNIRLSGRRGVTVREPGMDELPV